MRIEMKYRSKTSHLSSKEIEKLKFEYYSGNNIHNLMQKYKIDISPNRLYTTFPLVLVLDKKCKYCASPVYFVPPAKNAPNRKEYFCKTCQHCESIFICKCMQCLKLRYDEKQQSEITKLLQKNKKKSHIHDAFEYSNPLSLNMLSVKDKAYLGALLRVALDKKYLLIDINYGIPDELAPTFEYREYIITELLERKIITAYIFNINTNKQIIKEFQNKTLFDICVYDMNRSREELITYFMYPDEIPPRIKSEGLLVLREVQIYEAIEYMKMILQKFHLSIFNIEKRYELLFHKILNDYSLGQLFNFIYIAIRNQAAYTKIDSHRYLPISNYIYKKISDRYEQASINNWNIINFQRDWHAEQTELSKIVCNRLLILGENAFYQNNIIE